MQAWVVNAIALAAVVGAVAFIAAGALWRLGAWHLGAVDVLNLEDGLQIGSEAPELAAHTKSGDAHLGFVGEPTFLVFGMAGCKPCEQLIDVATAHPATRRMRLVYVSDNGELATESYSSARWEVYRFHDEAFAREQWRAPVSPYFHVIDPSGRVVAKGIGNQPAHLDRLLGLTPSVLSGKAAPEPLTVA